MQKFWRHAVAITDLVNPKTPPTEKYLYGVYDPTSKKLIGPVTYNNTSQISPPAFRVVSVNDFYHRQMSQADLNKLSLATAPCWMRLLTGLITELFSPAIISSLLRCTS